MTLPTDSKERKDYALFSGCLRYFPAALAGVSKTSKLGNDKHNPGEKMHHARNKSGDHGDCILRHLVDVDDLIVAMERGEPVTKDDILIEVSSMVWRALAFSQEIHERFGAPLAPGARTEEPPVIVTKEPLDLKSRIKFAPGDIAMHVNNDVEVIVQATYFDAYGDPVLFVKDSDGKIYGVEPDCYKTIYKEVKNV